MNVEESLADITADLVELKENNLFLERLFAAPAGQWLQVAALCSKLTHISIGLEELSESFEGTLHTTWLAYPESVYGDGYCLIVFFVEALHWSNVAIYNRRHFLRTRAK